MPEQYYQEYGPIRRRRASGTLDPDEPVAVEEIEAPPRAPRPPHHPEPLPERPASRARPARRRRARLLLPLMLVGALALAVALALPYVLTLLDGGLAIDNVSVQGLPVGRMNQAQIRAQLGERYADYSRAPVALEFEGRSWRPTLSELGAQLDLDRTAQEAVLAGRRGDPLQRAGELWAIWREGLDVAPRLTVDTARLQSYLSTLSTEVDRPPRDAAIGVTAGKVIPTAAEPGRQLLVDSTAIEIVRALESLTPQTVVVRSRTLAPTIGDAGIAAALTDAQQILAGPLTLKRGEQAVTWDAEKIAGLLDIGADGSRMTVGINPDRLSRQVARLAQVIDSPSVEPHVAFRRGGLAITREGQVGWRLQQPEAVAAISSTLRLGQRQLELPVEEIKPQVTPATLGDLGVVELVGEGVSSFAGSAKYRVTNIKAGAARMNGVLIPPGAEFSFNTQLGEVDEANGFVQGYAVVGNRTQLEWGGGVCQVSTTVFRAAFWSGLPFTEWHPHPFYISWYDAYAFPDQQGPGMDATIFTGQLDLKFVNDTGRWLMIEAVADEANQVLRVRLYGTKPDRSVVAKGPTIDNVVPPPARPVYVNDSSLPAGTVKQTDTARSGMDITVHRVITENGAQKAPESFFTSFKAWPNVFVRGTGS